jgi:mRNA interferase MazF
LPQIVVAAISSNMARSGHPSRVTILQESAEGISSGLHVDSVVMGDNIATVLETLIEKKIGRLMDLRLVDDALRYTLAL